MNAVILRDSAGFGYMFYDCPYLGFQEDPRYNLLLTLFGFMRGLIHNIDTEINKLKIDLKKKYIYIYIYIYIFVYVFSEGLKRPTQVKMRASRSGRRPKGTPRSAGGVRAKWPRGAARGTASGSRNYSPLGNCFFPFVHIEPKRI